MGKTKKPPVDHYRRLISGEPLQASDGQLDKLAQIMSNRAAYTDINRGPFRKFVVWILRRLEKIFGVELLPGGSRLTPTQIPAGYTYLAQLMIHDISRMDRTNRYASELSASGLAGSEVRSWTE